MPTSYALAGYRGNGSATSSSTQWATEAFTRVLNVPIKEMRRQGTPEQASPEFLRQFVAALRETFPRREDPITGEVTYAFRPGGRAGLLSESRLTRAEFSSFSHRARLEIADALTMLDAIEPIVVDERGRVPIIKGVIRGELRAIDADLDANGSHIEDILSELTKHVNALENDAGLVASNVITEEHEAIHTSFLVLRDHVDSLQAAWALQGSPITESETATIKETIRALDDTVDAAWAAFAEEGLDRESLKLVPVPLPPTRDEVPVTFHDLLEDIQLQVRFWRGLADSADRVGIAVIEPHAETLKARIRAVVDALIGDEDGGAEERIEILLPQKEEDRFVRIWRLFVLMQAQVRTIHAIAKAVKDQLSTRASHSTGPRPRGGAVSTSARGKGKSE